MVDRYCRKIEDVENDIENAMQISSILLKLKGYDNDLSKIGDNENSISNNLGKINDNENSISNNLGKINDNENSISNNLGKIDKNTSDISSNLGKINTNISNISDNSNLIKTNTSSISNISEFILKSDKDFEKTYNIEPQTFKFNTNNHSFSILEKEIEHDFIKNSLLFIKNNIYYKYDDLLDDHHRCQHEYNIFDDENNLIHKYLFNKGEYYDENSNILNTTEEFCIFLKKDYKKIKIVLELHRHNRHGYGNIDLEIDNGYIKVDYIEKGFLDNSHLVNLNTGSISTNSGLIETNTSDISDNLGKINTNEGKISSNLGKINTNEGKISSNLGKINTNEGKISSNLEKINDNKDDITALQTSNIKAFYNLDQIFIYDIEKGYQTVNKDNHFHIFEKEIIYNFTKNSYLEIALKVLTQISNYILIGFFQILCNFYDQDNNLFYTISLSTAMGSINKLSTIKSVFIVPINKNVSKIKIDFFIAPKESEQSRSGIFTIKDINSNKIYIKYFQKTDEMSIKDIQDSLSSVNSITSRVDNLEKSLYLKNLYNILYRDNDIKVNHFFFDKTFILNIKKNDFLEIKFDLQLEYDDVSNAKNVTTNLIFFNISNGQTLYSKSYSNNKYLTNTNNIILINDSINYNFEIDINKVKIAITFSTTTNLNITYKSINNHRLIIKHYGN